ncbi:MAG: PKD domain-containing protein [Cytophagales bacterium]
MKKNLLLFFFIVNVQFGYGQIQNVEPQGHVLDSSGNPVPFADLTIYYNWNTLGSFSRSIQSDINGNYIDSAILNVGEALRVIAVDCNGDSVRGPWHTVSQGQVAYIDTFTICPNAPPPICSASFTFSNITQNTIQFSSTLVPSPPAPGYTISWDFGDGSGTSNQQNPQYQYNTTGVYLVCLTYSDGNCTDVYCDSVSISFGPACPLNFTYQDFGSAFGFFGIDSLANPSSSYIWNFGDGNLSTGFNAVHNYQNPGMYNVCLEKIDSLNFCTFCDSILVSFDTSLLNLGGNIGINLISRSGDMVILYEETNSGTAPFIRALDTTINVNGAYVFHGLNPGAYSLRVMPENNSNDPGLIPQYWQNEFYWGNAGSIILNSSQQGINLNFTNNPNSLSGPASVVVSVRDSFNQYISNAVVWIENLNQTIIQYDITDQNSNVVFDNLPFGDYKVGTDYPGYYMFKEDVNLSNAFPLDSIGLSVQNGWLATSINQQIVNSNLSLYPNPIVDEFYLNEDLREYALVLRNIEAKKIALDIDYSDSHTRIRFKERPQSGLYILQIITKQSIICKKLFVR